MCELKIPPDVREDIDKAVSILLNKFAPNIHKIILFGSYAKDEYQPDSDIDLAVVLYELPPQKERPYHKMAVELEQREVDLLFCTAEQLASNKFVYRWINEQGVVLYEKL